MKLYRFSPIKNQNELFEAIKHLHLESNKLCFNSFDKYLPNAGNLGIFCHYDNEYKNLIDLRNKIVLPSDDPKRKYFKLINPIKFEKIGNIPETTYTHLYIRKPDPYRFHVGDIDFYLEYEEYFELKSKIQNRIIINNARIFDRLDLDMIELYDPNVDVLAYISFEQMSKSIVRTKQSDITKL